MRPIGFFVAGLGFLYLIVAFNMDVAVDVPSTYLPYGGRIGGGEVANLDLMARRENHIMVACLIILIGALMAIFGRGGEVDRADSVAASRSSLSTSFDGERSLTDDPYRLWLADRYGIIRNDVFDCFVVGDKTFPDLEASLAYCHGEEC